MILYECDDPEEINQYLIPQIITKFPNFDKKTVVIENSMIFFGNHLQVNLQKNILKR